MSLTMLIFTEGGMNYSESDFKEWTKNIGFKKVEFIKLEAACRAGIAYKWLLFRI